MCGDIETDESMAEEFYLRFVESAQAVLDETQPVTDSAEGADLYAYLDALFRSRLSAAAQPDQVPMEVTGYERLSMEPLVYARLAGFMAAHQPIDDDPLRRVLEAMMTGYAEGTSLAAADQYGPPVGYEHTH